MVGKIPSLRSHRRLERSALRGGEDHIEFVLAELAPDGQHRFRGRAEEGELAPLKEERRREAKAG